MAVNRFRIESFLDEMDLKYFFRDDDEVPSWILFFAEDIGLVIRLGENGEYLIMRSLPLLNLKSVPVVQKAILLSELLKRNDKLKVGHYCADESIVFETSIAIEDGELTHNQLHRCFGTVSTEICSFQGRLPAFCGLVAEADESIDSLVQRLIDGDDKSSGQS